MADPRSASVPGGRFTATVAVWLLGQVATVTLSCLLVLSPTVAGEIRGLRGALPPLELTRTRAIMLSSGLILLLLRIALTSLVLLPRRIEPPEAVAVGVWLAVIHLGFALTAMANPAPVGVPAIVGGVLFVAGSLLNTVSEYQRKRFRERPGNRGHLYTEGLFGLAMHINYFGDIVWAIGLAMITGSISAAAIPLLMTAMFVRLHIPRLDAHLAARYGEEFEEYRRSTKNLIPWLY